MTHDDADARITTRRGSEEVAALARLGTLAEEINREHEAAEKAINESLLHARRCGQLLIEAKGACEHGEWMGWVGGNFRGSLRTANGYMRIARRWSELGGDSQPVANLGIKGALAALAEPRDTDDPGPDVEPEPSVPLPDPGTMVVGEADSSRLRFMAWLVPSADHEGFYYATVLSWDRHTDEGDIAEGGVKPIRGERIHRLLDLNRFPTRRASWRGAPSEPWTYNELLFRSHEDYMQRWVLGP